MDIYAYVYCTMNVASRVGCPHIQMYIGVHKNKGLDKGYKGSGVLIRRAINKYGFENFKCYMIKAFDNYEDALEYERYLIKKYDAANYDNTMFYNVLEGGGKGPEGIRKGRRVWVENPETGERTNVPPEKVPEMESVGFIRQFHSKIHVINDAGEDLIIDHDEYDYYKSLGYTFNMGSVGPGKVWLTNGEQTKKVPESEVPKLISEGYRIGMAASGPYGQVSVHNPETGEIRYFQPGSNELQVALDNGFVPGTGTKPHLGKKFMNNGDEELFASPEEYDDLLSNGYVFGRLLHKYMTNGEEIIRVKLKDVPIKESEGYTFCRPEHNGNAGLIFITDGEIDRKIHPENLSLAEDCGFFKGHSANRKVKVHWYTNGIDNLSVDAEDEEPILLTLNGYTRGRMSNKRIEENKKVYNKLREFLELPPLDEG